MASLFGAVSVGVGALTLARLPAAQDSVTQRRVDRRASTFERSARSSVPFQSPLLRCQRPIDCLLGIGDGLVARAALPGYFDPGDHRSPLPEMASDALHKRVFDAAIFHPRSLWAVVLALARCFDREPRSMTRPEPRPAARSPPRLFAAS